MASWFFIRATSHTSQGSCACSCKGRLILIQRPYHCHGLPEFVSGLPSRGRHDANSSEPWNIIYTLPCGHPSRRFIHDKFFGSLGHQLLIWSELQKSPPFRPMRDFWMQWSPTSKINKLVWTLKNGNLKRIRLFCLYLYSCVQKN